jgi:diacylglycerol kinase (ATP)
MRVRAILNPRAGLAAARALQSVREGPWPDVEVKTTGAPGDARQMSGEAAAAGYDLVLSLGGDGTANEVAWGLLGTTTSLGLVPVGSGNGLARTLGIPLRPARAVAVLAQAVQRRMDVGTVNGRPFLNVAGAGFDAAVGADFQEHGRRGGRRGVLTYVQLSLRRTWGYEAPAFTLTAGASSFEGRALLVAFVNGRQYGGGAVVAPGARLDDGLLDIVVVKDAPRLQLAMNATRMFVGGIERFSAYSRFASPAAVLTGPLPILHHRDGEPEGLVDRLEVGLQPRALSILVPRHTADLPNGPFAPEK